MPKANKSPQKQLVLAWPVTERQSRDDFFKTPGNQRALDLISTPANWPDPIIVLTGPSGVGKTHLARIFAAEQGALMLTCDQLVGLGHLPSPALVFDSADQNLTLDVETGLFHLANLVRAHQGRLLLTARRAPQFWGLVTPDMLSRLRLALVVEVPLPDESVLRAAMTKLIAERQMQLEPALLEVLVTRLERSIPVLRQAIDRLDQLSLERQRPITRSMVYALVDDMSAPSLFAPEGADKDDDFRLTED